MRKQLTNREKMAIYSMVQNGATNKEIAKRFKISYSTASKYGYVFRAYINGDITGVIKIMDDPTSSCSSIARWVLNNIEEVPFKVEEQPMTFIQKIKSLFKR